MVCNFRSLGAATTIMVAALSFARDVSADDEFMQPQEIFEKAIRSPNRYVVYITVVDDNTGETNTGCVLAGLLGGAIHRELGLDNSVSAQQRALRVEPENKSHVFHFSKQAAIDNVPKEIMKQKTFRDACARVKQRKSVFVADLTGQPFVDR
jgi:hypothetical protein